MNSRDRGFVMARLIRRLRAILPAQNVLTRRVDMLTYGYDSSPTDYKSIPDCVVFPTNSIQISKILKQANELKIPVIPRGGGTNASGATVPVTGGIVLCLTKMNRILDIDAANRTATVEPGMVLQEFNDRLAERKLYFPPDPQSFFAATIGGMLAENSGGPVCVKYGVTKQYVLRIEAVLPSGDIIELGGHSMHSFYGYDLAGMLIGSEGTLGVITRATLRLLPLPAFRKMVISVFDNVVTAGDIVCRVLRSGIVPAKIELLDNWFIRKGEAFGSLGIPQDAAAIVFFETDGDNHSSLKESDLILDICMRYGAIEARRARDEHEAEQYWAARRAGYQMVLNSAPDVLDDDITVPLTKIPELLTGIQNLARKYNLEIPVLGHAGDGNMHPDILYDKSDPECFARAEQAMHGLVRLAIDLGGVISGEHGIGLEKKMYMTEVMDAGAIEISKAIKKTLDPNRIMNPEKIWS